MPVCCILCLCKVMRHIQKTIWSKLILATWHLDYIFKKSHKLHLEPETKNLRCLHIVRLHLRCYIHSRFMSVVSHNINHLTCTVLSTIMTTITGEAMRLNRLQLKLDECFIDAVNADKRSFCAGRSVV